MPGTTDMHLFRITFCALSLLTGTGGAVAAPAADVPVSEEPTREECNAAVAEARALATSLPADHLSRYFAERHLHQALVEAGNGEFDECVDMAARASDEVRERRHELRPGEKLKVLGADD